MSASSHTLTAPTARVTALLQGLGRPLRKRFLFAGLALLAIAAILASVSVTHARAAVAYTTAPIVRQTLLQTVSASGTVNPQNTITVGTQVSGTISEIDVDYNSRVHKGQVLARIDPSTLQAQLDQAQAQLAQAQDQVGAQAATTASARAGISSASATVERDQSALALAQNVEQRDANLLAQGYVARAQVQSDRDSIVAAQAALATAQAQVAQAASATQGGGDSTAAAQEGAAAQAAVVQQDQLNLQRTVITSPVDGTVVARDVSVGQTVAASLQTPTLFTIAQNLSNMEVDIAVGEPDIGSVRAGEHVDFTVLAYPNETFHGVVTQVRIDPTTVNNVVTYTVVTKVDNSAARLLPGMTATATIDVASAPNALVVPLQALQYRAHGTGHASPWGATAGGSAAQAVVSGSTGMIWVERDGKAVPVPVQVQLMSGTQAAVTPLRGTLDTTDAVITADSGAHHAYHSTSSASSSSPYRAMRGFH
ncbi:MAG: efflux RND transporter periplasmic adaptor subunit [Candidatus Tyrphobacter sp.]